MPFALSRVLYNTSYANVWSVTSFIQHKGYGIIQYFVQNTPGHKTDSPLLHVTVCMWDTHHACKVYLRELSLQMLSWHTDHSQGSNAFYTFDFFQKSRHFRNEKKEEKIGKGMIDYDIKCVKKASICYLEWVYTCTYSYSALFYKVIFQLLDGTMQEYIFCKDCHLNLP